MLEKGRFCSGIISIPHNSTGAWSMHHGNSEAILHDC